ncbi:iroquois-class homeodomain protein irx-3-like, partial [Passer montanus]|uniref:iroquois-class homeodomain protein irx-3-like n=1 Tax=Passer montanus TaxID=9160 RepID=UPI001961F730
RARERRRGAPRWGRQRGPAGADGLRSREGQRDGADPGPARHLSRAAPSLSLQGAQYELKESPGVQHAAFPPHHPAFYPYGQYQFGDPSRPKNATRESTSTLKA